MQAALSHWHGRKVFYDEYLQKFRASLPESHAATVGKVDPFVLQEMAQASSTVDKFYVEDFLCGFPVTGVVSAAGTGELIPGAG